MTDRDMFGDFTGPARFPTQAEDDADNADRHLFLALGIVEKHGWDGESLIASARLLVRRHMHPVKRAETEGK